MLLAMQWNVSLLLIFGLGLLTTVVVIRRFRRRGAPSAQRRSTRLHVPTGLAPPDEFRHWQVELHELGRDLQARLDSKISILQTLLIQSETAALRLEERLREVEERVGPKT